MDKWVKRKWLRALKSGEYQKGVNYLGRRDFNDSEVVAYCCLGVLVEEMAPEFVTEMAPGHHCITVDGKNGYLPDDLAIMWGLDQGSQGRLAEKNDRSHDFGPVIAYIEENL